MAASKSHQQPSKREALAERTTIAAMEIIDKETKERLEKTDRLRAARQKQEQLENSRTS